MVFAVVNMDRKVKQILPTLKENEKVVEGREKEWIDGRKRPTADSDQRRCEASLQTVGPDLWQGSSRCHAVHVEKEQISEVQYL